LGVLEQVAKTGQNGRIFVRMCDRENHKRGTPLEGSKHWFTNIVKLAGVTHSLVNEWVAIYQQPNLPLHASAVVS